MKLITLEQLKKALGKVRDLVISITDAVIDTLEALTKSVENVEEKVDQIENDIPDIGYLEGPETIYINRNQEGFSYIEGLKSIFYPESAELEYDEAEGTIKFSDSDVFSYDEDSKSFLFEADMYDGDYEKKYVDNFVNMDSADVVFVKDTEARTEIEKMSYELGESIAGLKADITEDVSSLEEKIKSASAECENVIEAIKVNGEEQEVIDKTVDISVPDSLSELKDDVGYAKSSEIPTKTSDLTDDVGYAKASDVDSEMSEVNERIDGIEAKGGEPNVIEVVKQNGTPLEVTDKAVDVTVPTKLSELENDSGYVDEAVRPNILRGSNSCTTLTGYRDGEWSDGEWGYYLSSSRPSSIEISDAPVPDIKAGWKLDNVNGGVVQANVPVVEGKSYMISCYCKGKGTLYFSFTRPSGSMALTHVEVDTDEWVQFFPVEKLITDIDCDTITVCFSANGDIIDFEEMEICGLKLEEGTTATPWCPSYWDMENKNYHLEYNETEKTIYF